MCFRNKDNCICVQPRFDLPDSYILQRQKLKEINDKLRAKYVKWRMAVLTKRRKQRKAEVNAYVLSTGEKLPFEDWVSYTMEESDIPTYLDLDSQNFDHLIVRPKKKKKTEAPLDVPQTDDVAEELLNQNETAN